MTTAEGLSLSLPLQAHSTLGGLSEEDLPARAHLRHVRAIWDRACA